MYSSSHTNDKRLTCKQLLIYVANTIGITIFSAIMVSLILTFLFGPMVFALVFLIDKTTVFMPTAFSIVIYLIYGVFVGIAVHDNLRRTWLEPYASHISTGAWVLGVGSFYTALFLGHYHVLSLHQSLLLGLSPFIIWAAVSLYVYTPRALRLVCANIPTTWDEPAQVLPTLTQSQRERRSLTPTNQMQTRRIIQIPEANHTIIVIAEPMDPEMAIVNNIKEARVEVI